MVKPDFDMHPESGNRPLLFVSVALGECRERNECDDEYGNGGKKNSNRC
jgi:hypothetical protein